MRIDAHQHFWQFGGNENDYGWMTGDYAVLGRNYGPEHLFTEMRITGFDGTIAVQARETVSETDYLLALADQHNEILGVVGWLDLCADNIEAELEKFTGRQKLKGFRMLIHDRKDVNFADTPAHVYGVSKLSQHDLTYDLLLKPQHLPAATRLVDALPNQKFVVDHIAKPDIANAQFEPWRNLIFDIARRPNVYCKLSSVLTQANWLDWTPPDITPFLDVALEAFGPDRIMIGSDWPVSTVVADYKTTIGVLMDWAKQLSPTEKAAYFGGNCARFYNLKV